MSEKPKTTKKHRPEKYSAIVTMQELLPKALESAGTFGKTELYKTGWPALDEWMGGGFGKEGTFEGVVIMGEPGIGKSTFALELLRQSVVDGVPQAWAILEDDIYQSTLRFRALFGNDAYAEKVMKKAKVEFLPQEMAEGEYSLDDIYDWFEMKFMKHGIRLFLFDNLQYAVDDAVEDTADYKKTDQDKMRRLMKRLIVLAKKHGLTIVMVSHVNRTPGAKGLNKLFGSASIGQNSTKVIEISRHKDNVALQLDCHKNRNSAQPLHPLYIQREGFRFREIRSNSSDYEVYHE